MPVTDKGTPMTSQVKVIIIVLLCIAIICLTLFSFSNGGIYGNPMVAAYLALGFIIWGIGSYRGKRTRKKCSAYTVGTVYDTYLRGSDSYLMLHYNVQDRSVYGEVKYFESRIPTRGQSVALYYNPDDSEVCMLADYKVHSPGWTKLTKKSLRGGIIAGLAFCLVFFGLSISLLTVTHIKRAEYTETTTATLLTYDPVYNIHGGDAPGTYSYTPLLHYTVNGTEYLGKGLVSYSHKPYEEGADLTVHYRPGAPGIVLIDGDYSTETGAVVLLLVGAIFLALTAKMVLAYPKRVRQLERLGTDTSFLLEP